MFTDQELVILNMSQKI